MHKPKPGDKPTEWPVILKNVTAAKVKKNHRAFPDGRTQRDGGEKRPKEKVKNLLKHFSRSEGEKVENGLCIKGYLS